MPVLECLTVTKTNPWIWTLWLKSCDIMTFRMTHYPVAIVHLHTVPKIQFHLETIWIPSMDLIQLRCSVILIGFVFAYLFNLISNAMSYSFFLRFAGHRPTGATDMKLTNLDLLLLQQFVAISGPTYDPLPPFRWSTSDFKDLPHYGQPDQFAFGPLVHQWKWL